MEVVKQIDLSALSKVTAEAKRAEDFKRPRFVHRYSPFSRARLIAAPR